MFAWADIVGSIWQAIVNWVVAMWAWVQALGWETLMAIFGALSAMIPGASWDVIKSGLANLNYYAPVSEAFAAFLLLFAEWAAVAVYRFAKSWVPTVSGS